MDVEASEPTVTEIVLLAAAELASVRKMFVAVAVNTDVPLNVVLLPMRSISALICVNSASRAVRWLLLTVPVADSVASVTARFRSVVTWARPPSETCSAPTPFCALAADWLRAVTFACKPFAIARPAASSAPELMRDPEESWNNVFCSLVWVTCN